MSGFEAISRSFTRNVFRLLEFLEINVYMIYQMSRVGLVVQLFHFLLYDFILQNRLVQQTDRTVVEIFSPATSSWKSEPESACPWQL